MLGDAAIHYEWQNWRAALNVINVTDETYVANCSSPTACFYGDRRRVTASLSLQMVMARTRKAALKARTVRLWSVVHTWTSLVSTVFLLLLCLTGLPLIFHHEIDEAAGLRSAARIAQPARRCRVGAADRRKPRWRPIRAG